MSGWPFTSVTTSGTGSTTPSSVAAPWPGSCRSTASRPDEWQPEDAFQLVADELMLDGNSRQNLATFCQTWEEPQVHRLMDLAIDKNMIDKDEYPQTAEIERRCVHMLADLWNAPESANTVGASAIGSSEACMLGGHGRQVAVAGQARAAAGKPTDRPNMVCGPVQVVWHKFAKYWDIEMREVPMSPGPLHDGRRRHARAGRREHDHGRADVRRDLHGRVRAGASRSPTRSTQLQADTGLDIDIHVDGASGAFLAPFCAPDLVWDFRLPRVKSISTSGHKFGLAPLGVGWVVWRDVAELPDDLIFHVNYLGGDMPVFQINFSRPAGPDRRAVLRLPPPRPRGLPAGPRWPPTTPGSTSPRRSRSSARSS